MSQQSNPAILREALKHFSVTNGMIRFELYGVPMNVEASADVVKDGPARIGAFHRLIAALAASGTEAAPIGELEKRRQYQATHARIQGGDDFDQDEPAGAAASPEGEGRDMVTELDDLCAVLYEKPEPFEVRAKTLAAFLTALRQSAAPSGGDLDTPSGGGNYGDRIKELVADWKSQIAMRAHLQDRYQSGVRRGLEMAVSDVEGLNDAVATTESAPQQLQTESKTGAVKEPHDA